jgi:predicted Co/Zn/Cd cation transporter (cation efflux family)
MNVDTIEKRALWVTVAANLIMAAAGWFTYSLTHSQAILLDGNFSFVLAVATVIAIIISKNKHKKTATFPYGSYVYEAAFVLSKGLLILGIISVAFIQNTVKIIAFFQGKIAESVVLVPIYYYTIFILILTLLLLWYFNVQNKKSNNKSSMLMVEAASAKVDGVITVATGLVFFVISFIAVGSRLSFLLYIGDALIVIAMSILMLGTPLKIIKNAFIELGGGTLQNQNEKQEIESAISEVIQGGFSFSSYISKVGSGYLVVVYIASENKNLSLAEYKIVRQKIKQKLNESIPTIMVEIALKD